MKEIVKFIKEGLKITSNTKVNERPKYNSNIFNNCIIEEKHKPKFK